MTDQLMKLMKLANQDEERCIKVPVGLMKEALDKFSNAWSRGDIDTLMALMSSAPVYRTSGGTTFEGRDAVRQGFTTLCKPDSAAPAPPSTKAFFFEDKCLTFWSLTLPSLAGDPQKVDGVDVISFDTEGRIRLKDAYRKLA